MAYLLDTNVISELRKSNADPRVRAWTGSIAGQHLFLSVLVIGEARQGIERLRRRDRLQADVLDRWLERVKATFGERILPLTLPIAEEWGRMNVPDPLPPIDGLLAATARVHGLILVTRNIRDLARTGVPLLDPWAAG
jgi:predicted nucleic acid-binding protein